MMTKAKIKLIEKALKHRNPNCKLLGEAWTNGEIWINRSQSESSRLDTVIHESLHVCYPRWSEGRVRRVASKVAGVLWKDLWRRRLKKKCR